MEYIHGKPIKSGYKIWVIATPGGYVLQFCPYERGGTSDNALGLDGSVVSNLISCLPRQDGSMYHTIFDNFFTSLRLLIFSYSICRKMDLQTLEHCETIDL